MIIGTWMMEFVARDVCASRVYVHRRVWETFEMGDCRTDSMYIV